MPLCSAGPLSPFARPEGLENPVDFTEEHLEIVAPRVGLHEPYRRKYDRYLEAYRKTFE